MADNSGRPQASESKHEADGVGEYRAILARPIDEGLATRGNNSAVPAKERTIVTGVHDGEKK